MSWAPLSGVSLHQGAFLDRLSPCWIRCPSFSNILCITQSLYSIYYNHLLCVNNLEQTMKLLRVLHLIQHPFKVCWMNVHINEWTHRFLSPSWFLRGAHQIRLSYLTASPARNSEPSDYIEEAQPSAKWPMK